MTSNDFDAAESAGAAARQTLARDILRGIVELIEDARDQTRPLEVDPYRSRLFEFYVMADAGGLIPDDRDQSALPADDDDEENDERNLSADGLCRQLAREWGLDMAARESAAAQTRLAAEQLELMRLLWSVMRMWMEWSYAWRRWPEFHSSDTGDRT